MSQNIPASLVREQLPAITGMTTGLLWSMTPKQIKNQLVDANAETMRLVNANGDVFLAGSFLQKA